MNKIYLVRHGETFWNRSGQYQGAADIQLNARGLAQADACAVALAEVPFDKIICSDLSRATITAEAIAAYHPGIPIEKDERLREINFGAWEGLTYDEISEKWPGLIEKMYSNAETVSIPGGESFIDLQKRAWAAVKEALTPDDKDQTLLVVCHGGTIRTLICKVLQIHLSHAWNFRQGNTAITILEYYGDGPFNTLQLLNDTAHIRSLEGDPLCG